MHLGWSHLRSLGYSSSYRSSWSGDPRNPACQFFSIPVRANSFVAAKPVYWNPPRRVGTIETYDSHRASRKSTDRKLSGKLVQDPKSPATESCTEPAHWATSVENGGFPGHQRSLSLRKQVFGYYSTRNFECQISL